MAILLGRRAGLALLEALGVPSKNVMAVDINMPVDGVVKATVEISIEPATFARLAEILQREKDAQAQA
jgi:ACT domain-containing protein